MSPRPKTNNGKSYRYYIEELKKHFQNVLNGEDDHKRVLDLVRKIPAHYDFIVLSAISEIDKDLTKEQQGILHSFSPLKRGIALLIFEVNDET